MRTFKHSALTMLLALVSVSASAYDFLLDGVYYKIINKYIMEGTCKVTFSSVNLSSDTGSYSGDVVIPSLVTFNGMNYIIREIDDYAFCYSNNLTSVTIPQEVSAIGEFAFCECHSLKDVYISNLSAWCKIKFAGLYSNPFAASLSEVQNIYLNNKLITDLVIPDDIITIGDYTFFKHNCLKSIEIPYNVRVIGYAAFAQIYGLTSVSIGDGVQTVGDGAFEYCFELKSLKLGKNIETIGKNAFNYCLELRDITSFSAIPPSIDAFTFNGVPKTECTLKVPESSVEAYKKAPYWSEFPYIVAIESSNISTPTADFQNGKTYNLNGMEVNGNHKGLVIRNGRKVLDS